MTTTPSGGKMVPIAEGLMTEPLSPPQQVNLKGSRCRKCREVFWGKRTTCEYCSGEDMEDILLSRKGILYTFTTINHRPSGDYKGPDPFVPFGLGAIELPEGVRVVAPLTISDPARLKVGMAVELVVDRFFTDENGNEVMAPRFRPLEE